MPGGFIYAVLAERRFLRLNLDVVCIFLNESDIKAEENNIPVLYHIVFTFHADKTFFLGGSVGLAVQKILIIYDLRLNKAALKVGMDFSGGLGSFCTLTNRPCTGFFLAGCQIADETQKTVARSNKFFKAGFCKAEIFQKHFFSSSSSSAISCSIWAHITKTSLPFSAAKSRTAFT